MNHTHVTSGKPVPPFLRRIAADFPRWIGIELNPTCSKEKLIAGIGGFVALLLLIFISSTILETSNAPAFIASTGASAVLLFAVPHGQLSQPWPVIAGHAVSALVGVACAKWIPSTPVAAACAVGISIALMHHLKCIHPPGGATALTAVIGGEAIRSLGFHFVLFPVVLNAVMIVAIAILFNLAFKWRRYPLALTHSKEKKASATHTHEEIVSAFRELGSFVDISEDDLLKLLHILEENKRLPGKRRFRKAA